MALGNNGDLYIDDDSGDYYAKVDGVWEVRGNIKGPQGAKGDQGLQGPQGNPGTPGAVVITSDILFGSGIPDDGLGTDGQVYVDTDTETVYKKVSGHWEEQTNLKGNTGFSFLSGNGLPDDGNGIDGDSYVDLVSGLTYAKSSGTWTATGSSLQGPQGPAGAAGSNGSAGAAGARGSFWFGGSGAPGTIPSQLNGDNYLDDDTGDVYKLISGVWTLEANLRGDPGPQGDPGVDGTTWTSGSAVPSASAADGDYYLRTTNGQVYKRISGSWVDQSFTLKGADGTNGTNGINGTTGNIGGMIWSFDNSGNTSSVGSGRFRLDDPVLADAAHIYLSDDGDNVSGIAGILAQYAVSGSVPKFNILFQSSKMLNNSYASFPVTAFSHSGTVTTFTVDTANIVTNFGAGLSFGNGSLYAATFTNFAGPKGDPGTDGTDGTNGTNGSNGANGSVWTSGSAAPTAGAADGDYYLRTTNGEVYKRVSGAWVDQSFSLIGPPGTDGTDGTNGTNGSDGANGSVWTSGSAVPSASAADGDYYLRSSNGEVYKRVSGAWVDQSFSLVGPAGTSLTLATQAEAEAGTENTHYMTALRVAEAIAALGGGGGGGGSTVTVDAQTLTSASGDWTKPTGAVMTFVSVVGSGAGGASGNKRANAAGGIRGGGAGGAAGYRADKWIPAALLGSTEPYVVGQQTNGGAAQTSNDAAGNLGTNGGDSYFGTPANGTYVRAKGGLAGEAGGSVAAFQGNNPTNVLFGGMILGNNGGNGQNNGDGLAGNNTGEAICIWKNGGGGGGGAGNAVNVSTSRQGGSGGLNMDTGTGAAGGINTANGTTATAWGGGGGGGGSGNGAGGSGGDGAIPGGGGGGGGGGTGANSGAGGKGARGEVRVYTICVN